MRICAARPMRRPLIPEVPEAFSITTEVPESPNSPETGDTGCSRSAHLPDISGSDEYSQLTSRFTDDPPSHNFKRLAGTKNCFLNAVVQLLSSCGPSFTAKLVGRFEEGRSNSVCGSPILPVCKKDSCPTCWLSHVFWLIAHSQKEPVSLSQNPDVKQPKLPPNPGPQDLQGFVKSLLQNLEKDFSDFSFRLKRQVKCQSCHHTWYPEKSASWLTLYADPEGDIAEEYNIYCTKRSSPEFPAQRCPECSFESKSPAFGKIEMVQSSTFVCVMLDPKSSLEKEGEIDLDVSIEFRNNSDSVLYQEIQYSLHSALYWCKDGIYMVRSRSSDGKMMDALDEAVTVATSNSWKIQDASPSVLFYKQIHLSRRSEKRQKTSTPQGSPYDTGSKKPRFDPNVTPINGCAGDNVTAASDTDVSDAESSAVEEELEQMEVQEASRNITLKKGVSERLLDQLLPILEQCRRNTSWPEIRDMIQAATAEGMESYKPTSPPLSPALKRKLAAQIFKIFVYKQADCITEKTFKKIAKWKQVTKAVFAEDECDIAKRSRSFKCSTKYGFLQLYTQALVAAHQQICDKECQLPAPN